MPGSVVPVAPGRTPTQLSGAPFDGGTTIFNNSDTYEVWVSRDQSIIRGSGYRIGPLGSLTWRGGIPWAIVGTDRDGLLPTEPVLLNVSDDIKDPVNPVDVAIAAASAGIPATNLNQPITLQTLTPGQTTVIYDVKRYGSAMIYCTSNPNDQNGISVEHMVTQPDGSIVTVTTTNIASLNNLIFGYQVPLVGDRFRVRNSLNSVGSVNVSGMLTTRTLIERFLPDQASGFPNGFALIDRRSNYSAPFPGALPFDLSFRSNGGSASTRFHIEGNAGETYYVGLRRWDFTHGVSAYDDSIPWGPFKLAVTGINEYFYPDVAVPRGFYSFILFAAGMPASTPFVNVQMLISGDN